MTHAIRIVLMRPSHPGNIGASARAMKNMGLEDLCLVQPAEFPHAEATARASGADDVLHRARVCEDLESAVSDCGFVVAASARRRSLAWPELNPHACAIKLATMRLVCPVAIVFGPEQSGLSNDEVMRCNVLSTISATPGYADDVLHRARVCKDLESAVSDCGFVVAASARRRSLAWPELNPHACAIKLATMRLVCPVAIVFGPEQSGLSNDEVMRCNVLSTISANPQYSSLNLAMAVQIFAYELRQAIGNDAGEAVAAEAPPATSAELEHYFEHLERILLATGFLKPHNPRHLMLRLRRLFLRAELDKNEINILRARLFHAGTCLPARRM